MKVVKVEFEKEELQDKLHCIERSYKCNIPIFNKLYYLF